VCFLSVILCVVVGTGGTLYWCSQLPGETNLRNDQLYVELSVKKTPLADTLPRFASWPTLAGCTHREWPKWLRPILHQRLGWFL